MNEKLQPLADTSVSAFITELQRYHNKQAFNPWVDYEPSCDCANNAPAIRSDNLRRYLQLRRSAHYLFIAEGLGYQGGHFSGMAMTSERILLGFHPDIKPQAVLGEYQYRRTSNPNSELLNSTQKKYGFNEPTATVMWTTLAEHGVDPFDVVLWNIFPFHPYKQGNVLTNRAPSVEELAVGLVYAQQMLALVPQAVVVAVGQKSAKTLTQHGINCQAVPHPSMGGVNRFKAALALILKK